MAKRVLISGASIAGPALAFWLSRYGFEVTVVERSPALRPGGYAVDFRGTATRVLERMGLVEAVKRHETRTGSITMVDTNGKVVARLAEAQPMSSPRKRAGYGGLRGLTRSGIHAELRSECIHESRWAQHVQAFPSCNAPQDSTNPLNKESAKAGLFLI